MFRALPFGSFARTASTPRPLTRAPRPRSQMSPLEERAGRRPRPPALEEKIRAAASCRRAAQSSGPRSRSGAARTCRGRSRATAKHGSNSSKVSVRFAHTKNMRRLPEAQPSRSVGPCSGTLSNRSACRVCSAHLKEARSTPSPLAPRLHSAASFITWTHHRLLTRALPAPCNPPARGFW